MKSNYVVITPVRNEEKYFDKTIESMVTQTLRPTNWVIVDDGSTDKTPQIISAAVDKYPWIVAIHRKNRGYRKSGGGVVEAFYDGYSALQTTKWNFIVKLDGDLSFAPEYFEKCLSEFQNESKLGIGGGSVYVFHNKAIMLDSPSDPLFHVRGASKIYRRACWNQISPLEKLPGWDTIDEVKANMHGWKTRTFSEIKIYQHKATGAADGNWRNWFKNGLANYISGYHPIFMLAKCIRRMNSKPLFIASAALFAGFCSGYLKRDLQICDQSMIRYLRRNQIRRLLGKTSIYN
jgi:glycosyltransferase involved in cell wall biosynthesis